MRVTCADGPLAGQDAEWPDESRPGTFREIEAEADEQGRLHVGFDEKENGRDTSLMYRLGDDRRAYLATPQQLGMGPTMLFGSCEACGETLAVRRSGEQERLGYGTLPIHQTEEGYGCAGSSAPVRIWGIVYWPGPAK